MVRGYPWIRGERCGLSGRTGSWPNGVQRARRRCAMKCACGNDARYIDEDGNFCCAICPIMQKKDAIKLASVPALLKLVREDTDYMSIELGRKFDEIVGRKP